MTITWRKVLHNALYLVAGLVWAVVVWGCGPAWPGILLISLGAVILARLFLWPWLRVIAFTAGASLPTVAMSVFLFHPVIDNWWHRTKFEAADWRSRPPSADYMWPARLRMVDDLLSRHDFHGWQRSRVVALLGEPDHTRWDSDNQMVYFLGPERGLFRIDSECLVFSLNTDDVVRDYKLRRD